VANITAPNSAMALKALIQKKIIPSPMKASPCVESDWKVERLIARSQFDAEVS
jgi:hypothetical protein